MTGVSEFRKYRNPSSISPFWSGQHHMKRFGSTVNQTVVHPMDKLLSLTEGFGDAVNQAVAHPA